MATAAIVIQVPSGCLTEAGQLALTAQLRELHTRGDINANNPLQMVILPPAGEISNVKGPVLKRLGEIPLFSTFNVPTTALTYSEHGEASGECGVNALVMTQHAEDVFPGIQTDPSEYLALLQLIKEMQVHFFEEDVMVNGANYTLERLTAAMDKKGVSLMVIQKLTPGGPDNENVTMYTFSAEHVTKEHHPQRLYIWHNGLKKGLAGHYKAVSLLNDKTPLPTPVVRRADKLYKYHAVSDGKSHAYLEPLSTERPDICTSPETLNASTASSCNPVEGGGPERTPTAPLPKRQRRFYPPVPVLPVKKKVIPPHEKAASGKSVSGDAFVTVPGAPVDSQQTQIPVTPATSQTPTTVETPIATAASAFPASANALLRLIPTAGSSAIVDTPTAAAALALSGSPPATASAPLCSTSILAKMRSILMEYPTVIEAQRKAA